MKGVHILAFVLLVAGGLNWLLVGLFGWDASAIFGGQGAAIPRIIYVLVGLAAIGEIFWHGWICRLCKTDHEPNPYRGEHHG